jgi:hypothetical protein
MPQFLPDTSRGACAIGSCPGSPARGINRFDVSEKPIAASRDRLDEARARSNLGSGVRALASVPRSVDDPAATGGGSLGYNASLRLNQW